MEVDTLMFDTRTDLETVFMFVPGDEGQEGAGEAWRRGSTFFPPAGRLELADAGLILKNLVHYHDEILAA